MHDRINPDAYRIRLEAKINIIAKAANWIVGITVGALIYGLARTAPSFELEQNTAFYVALFGAGIACWFIVEWPMRRIEKRFPLYDDDE